MHDSPRADLIASGWMAAINAPAVTCACNFRFLGHAGKKINSIFGLAERDAAPE
jgi:hypothetical protein